jgi:tetratricopeptide (TPR) repeat protein
LLSAAESRLKAALAVASRRAEASLRLGSIALRRGRTEEALTQLSAASIESRDPYIVHLAHLLSGSAFARMNRWREAVKSYRAAAGVLFTQTTQTALVVALSHLGEYQEAATLADSALNVTDRVQDPWLSYGQGDFRHWPDLIARVRGATVR